MKKRNTSRKSQTDWKRVDALTEKTVDYSDNPEWTPQMFAKMFARLTSTTVPLILLQSETATLHV